jgi:hypothetical protein
LNISGTTLAIILAISSAATSLAGVVIAGIFAHLNTRETKRSEERRHQRELIIRAATESWKQQMEAYAIHQQPIVHVPLEVYIIRMVKFSEAFLEDDFDRSTMAEKMKEIRSTTRDAIKYSAPASWLESDGGE